MRTLGWRHEHPGLRKNRDRVVAPKREGIVRHDAMRTTLRDVRHHRDVAFAVGRFVVNRGWVNTAFDSKKAGRRLQGTRRSHAVAEHGFHARNRYASPAKDLVHDGRFCCVVGLRSGAVGVHEVDVSGLHACLRDGSPHGRNGPGGVGVRPRDVVRVAGETEAAHLGLKGRAPFRRVALALQNKNRRAFSYENSLAILVEGLALARCHGGQAHKSAELKLLNQLRCTGDHHVGFARTYEVIR